LRFDGDALPQAPESKMAFSADHAWVFQNPFDTRGHDAATAA